MAETVKIGSLVITIEADTKGVDKGAKDAETSLQRLERGFTNVSRAAGALGIALGAAQIIQFTQQAVASAAALGRMADAAGVSAQQLQVLQFAFRDTAVNQEQLAQASATLARNLSELQTGTGGFLQFLRESAPQLVAQFRGVTDVNEAWGILADTLSRLPNRFDQIRVAQAALGEVGARVAAEMARLGREGLTTAEERARALGQVLEDHTTKQARELEVRFRELSTVLSNTFATAAVRAAEALGLLERTEAQRRARMVADQAEIAEIERRLKEEILRHDERNALLQRQARLLRDVLNAEMQLAQARGAPTTPPPTGGEPTSLLDPNRFLRAQEALAIYMDRLQGLPVLFEGVAMSGQTYGERVAEAERLIMATTADGDAARARSTQMRLALARQEQQAILSTASLAASTITSLFPKSKAAAVAAAIINTSVGITRALSEVPWPLNWVQAGLIAASGIAQLTTIRSTTPSGGGANPSVGGGGGGAPTAAEGAPQGRTLTIQGIDPAALFSGRQVENLLGMINEEVANGATLISTRNVNT